MNRAIRFLLAVGLLLAVRAPATAQPPSELLEQGIFTEETVGDVDGAVAIYERIIADAKAGRAHVAQAYYRLGLCHLKQGHDAQARETFKRLIDDYAEQTELVAKAREHMPAQARLEPAPWVDGEQLSLDIKLATGVRIGAFITSIESAVVDGKEAWHVELRRFVAVGGNNQAISRVDVERESLAPITGSFKHTLLGHVETHYHANRIEVVQPDKPGDDATRTIELQGTVYDNEEAIHLMRRLPLDVGYKTTLSVLAPLGKVVDFTIEVPERERVTVPAGAFDCFKLNLSIGQKFWFSADSNRYLVKFEAEGVTAELVSISRRKAGEAVVHDDPGFGYSVAAPAGWSFYGVDDRSRQDVTVLALLDANADGANVLELSKRTPDETESVSERARKELEGARQRFTGYALREDSWTERSIAGRPVVSFVGDYKEGEEPWVQYRAYVTGEKLAAEFIFKTPAARFEQYRGAFESIIASYRESL